MSWFRQVPIPPNLDHLLADFRYALRGMGRSPGLYATAVLMLALGIGMMLNRAASFELRFFCGLSIEETAEVLGLSSATVKRKWSTARIWLHHQLSRTES